VRGDLKMSPSTPTEIKDSIDTKKSSPALLYQRRGPTRSFDGVYPAEALAKKAQDGSEGKLFS